MNLRSEFESTQPTPQGKTPWVRRGLLVLTSLLVLGMAVGAGLHFASAAPAPWANLPQSVAPQIGSAAVTGNAADAQRLTLGVTLQSKNEAALKAYAQDIGKPKSKVFHQYLTPKQFAQYFGADVSKLDAVEKYFQSKGLHLDSATSGGLFLQFTGSVAQVNAALNTHIKNYRGADGRTFYANATALQVPSALSATIINVAGTENARQSHPAGLTAAAHNGANVAKSSVKKASVVHPHASVSCPTNPTFSGAGAPYTATGLLPAQLNRVYNFQNTTNPGNGMWAAFVEMDGFSLADLAQYANCVGISSTIQNAITGSASSANPFIITQNVSMGMGNVLSQTGQNFGTPLTTGMYANQVEEELEITLGLVPSISHISVVQTANTALGIQTALSTIANENAAQVVGYQWGMCEADVGFSNASAEQQLFLQMALQGQTVLAATGNNGLYACAGDGNNFRQTTFSVQDPASDPFVTAVGGTKLGLTTNVGSTAAWAAEEPWSNSPTTNMAGGGGISQFWAAPSWQQSAGAAITTALGGMTGVRTLYNPNTVTNSSVAARVIPDVSAVADVTNTNVGTYCSLTGCNAGGFTNMGGTTAALAIWAAASIEANQTSGAALPAAGGRVGLLAPSLYAAYQNDTTAGTGLTTLNNFGAGTTSFCDYAKQLGSIAVGAGITTSTAVNVSAAVTVVPVSMNGIMNGMKVTLPGAGNNNLTVSNVTATSFQVTLGATAVAAAATITPSYIDTITTATFGPGTVSVAVGATAGLQVGQYLLIDPGAASSEIVTVTAITDATHFTATFAKAHATAANNVVGTLVNATSVAGSQTQTTTTTTYELGAAGQTAVTPSAMTGIVNGATVTIAGAGTESVAITVPAGANYFVATFANVHGIGVGISGGGHVASNSGVNFGYTCAAGAGNNFILNNSGPLSNGAGTYVTEYFQYNTTYQFQQPPITTTLMYGKDAGFAVRGAFGGTQNSGYNALTGLGSPNVGQTNATSGQLATYLLLQSRNAQSRAYMVAQGLSDNKYWIASYSTNPYVPNMASNTAWFSMNTVAFSGPPVIVDDGNANPGNLFILGPAMPTASGVALYQWNIATATARQVALAGGNLPGAYAGSTTSCSSVSAATDGTGDPAANVGVYCVTPSGALYSTKIALAYNGAGQFTGATISNWTNSPLLNTVGYAPQISSDHNGNYLVLETNTGGSGVYYQYFAGVGGAGIAFNSTAAIALFPSAAGAASGLSPFTFGTPLATTCLTTPSAAYVAASNVFAAACTASDTKQMWANVFYPPNTTAPANLPMGKFNGTWTLLGQPSTSVTFMPGNAVAVDNYASDQSYGQIFYIAEGSDKAMYLNATNATAANFLGKMTGWQSVSLPGIFASNSAADFVDA